VEEEKEEWRRGRNGVEGREERGSIFWCEVDS
jgi:hypothetical protein